ncbi:putative ribosomal large subunit pseudouridine synthase SVR1, chloroplastic isoform X4 [Elaeis guineensis]|uniref:Ribosomal large subunit pseudouridine synthase SVR1, chloroplastic isoform X3 n=1 Tax=Elaeis guineensis var. tenera TaxID=51953 RepID=A0A8N4EVE8_ELAGV|nr:putative ribosomal large subunit pseudouridine synthase SVR1, chloroplastic isoform X3 [Elaeis guineensis]
MGLCALPPRLGLMFSRIQSMLMVTVFLRSCLQNYILRLTSQKGWCSFFLFCLKYKCADTGIFAQMARNQNRLSPYSMTISRVGLCFQNKTNPGIPKPRLFTVGRLDVATTGLILLTNDGDFAQRLSHPSSELAKEYIATIEGSVHKRHLLAISDGTQIEGVHCIPDFVELLPVQPDASRPRIRVVVHEGRNHEVRELIKNAGLQLHSLKRVRVGGFKLPSDLGLGKYVELEQPDIKLLEGNAQKST